jgi:hypothetical protein
VETLFALAQLDIFKRVRFSALRAENRTQKGVSSSLPQAKSVALKFGTTQLRLPC